jgi:hypothetical protein
VRFRLVFVSFCMLAILSGPTAAALASGGSAGDQQYTDPFGSTKTSSTHTASSQPAATTPAPSTTNATVATSTVSGSTPVATAATSTASAGTGKTLPYTGLDLWTVSGLGLTLLVSGLLIRFRSRRA